jgi:hypothetical protein
MKSKSASKSSARSLHFEPRAALLLIAASALAIAFVAWHGWTLWYGDGEAHQSIVRRIFDSRTPGYEQIGTVWLPLPHLLMLPFVQFDALYRSGIGGALGTAIGYICAGLFLFHGLRRLFGAVPAWAGLLAWTLNPNLLFQQAIPMTEPVSLCCVLGLFWALTRLRDTQSWGAAALAGLFATLGTMARYEAWGLLPVGALCVLILSGERRVWKTVLFCGIAALCPLYWLAHNQILFGNALEFYNGPYSAIAINQRYVDAGGFRYPGDHDLRKGFLYYRTAAALCLGAPLLYAGALGLIVAVFKRAWWAAILFFTVAIFYVLSLYSGGTPIFVPGLFPHSYYNVRYGLNAMPLACLGIAALVALMPVGKPQKVVAALLVVIAMSPWLLYPRGENMALYQESERNSKDRRYWTSRAVKYLESEYHGSDGIYMSFGDLTGIVREAGIPLRDTLHEGNGAAWQAALQRPDIALNEEWALCFKDDKISKALAAPMPGKTPYARVYADQSPEGKVVEIWKRTRRP